MSRVICIDLWCRAWAGHTKRTAAWVREWMRLYGEPGATIEGGIVRFPEEP